MTSSTEVSPAADHPNSVATGSMKPQGPVARTAKPRRRTATSVLASLAVIAFAGAIVAPTGVALAEGPVQEEAAVASVYSLAAKDTQQVAPSEFGATISPVDRGTFDVYVTPTPTPEPVPATNRGSGGGGGGGGGGLPPYSGGGDPAAWMAAAGIPASDWQYVDYIVSRESSWNPNATNRSSGACGLVQALPCSKVPGNGYNPVDNLRWGNGYAVGRYGSWAGAYAFWTANHWW